MLRIVNQTTRAVVYSFFDIATSQISQGNTLGPGMSDNWNYQDTTTNGHSGNMFTIYSWTSEDSRQLLEKFDVPASVTVVFGTQIIPGVSLGPAATVGGAKLSK